LKRITPAPGRRHTRRHGTRGLAGNDLVHTGGGNPLTRLQAIGNQHPVFAELTHRHRTQQRLEQIALRHQHPHGAAALVLEHGTGWHQQGAGRRRGIGQDDVGRHAQLHAGLVSSIVTRTA
jgi:hypothetical protein